MSYTFDSGRPIYTQLLEKITTDIVSGALEPGQRLPGVREMAAEYGVNPNTVQRTMAELERQGLVYAERTTGRFVTTDTERLTATRTEIARKLAYHYLKTMRDLGMPTDEIKIITQSIHEDLMKGESR